MTTREPNRKRNRARRTIPFSPDHLDLVVACDINGKVKPLGDLLRHSEAPELGEGRAGGQGGPEEVDRGIGHLRRLDIPEAHVQAVLMRILDGSSYAEIGRQLQVHGNTAKVWILAAAGKVARAAC